MLLCRHCEFFTRWSGGEFRVLEFLNIVLVLELVLVLGHAAYEPANSGPRRL